MEGKKCRDNSYHPENKNCEIDFGKIFFKFRIDNKNQSHSCKPIDKSWQVKIHNSHKIRLSQTTYDHLLKYQSSQLTDL